jgi:hypothetical protein
MLMLIVNWYKTKSDLCWKWRYKKQIRWVSIVNRHKANESGVVSVPTQSKSFWCWQCTDTKQIILVLIVNRQRANHFGVDSVPTQNKSFWFLVTIIISLPFVCLRNDPCRVQIRYLLVIWKSQTIILGQTGSVYLLIILGSQANLAHINRSETACSSWWTNLRRLYVLWRPVVWHCSFSRPWRPHRGWTYFFLLYVAAVCAQCLASCQDSDGEQPDQWFMHVNYTTADAR